MTNSKRDYSLEYRHMICNGQQNKEVIVKISTAENDRGVK